MSCGATRDWLHRDAASLDEAQRLQLDDHLATCLGCRDDRARLRLVREVGTALPVPAAGAREYSRAIARALLEGRPRVDAPPSRWAPLRRYWYAPLAIGAVAAAAIAIVIHRDDTPAPQVAPIEVPIDPPHDVVADFHATFRTQGTPHAAPGTIDVVASTPFSWSNDDRELVIDPGTVVIDSASELVTRVITDRFEVELANATVTVEPDGVRAVRGTARVVDRQRVLLAEVATGSVWHPEIEIDEPMVRKPKPKTRLADARVQLAAGHADEAERIASAVIAHPPSRGDEAEARMFLADLAKAAGQLDVAISRYQEVATKFPDLPAAESALYAAGRTETRRGHRDAARALYDRYLDRYPTGRYADDVRKLRSP